MLDSWNYMLRRLYDWVLSWADKPYANHALFLVAFTEATFFPIPPDVLLIAMAIGAPNKAIRFALICTFGSVLGAMLGYYMGWGLWGIIDNWFYLYIPGFSESVFTELSNSFKSNTFLTIFAAGFTPIPFKVFTIAAGAAMLPFFVFLVASLLSRGLRYGMLALLIYKFGSNIKKWIEKYFNLITWVVTILVIIIIILIKIS